MIVTPWKALTCADDSHEWEPLYTGPTDAWSTIVEHGLYDLRGVYQVLDQSASVQGARNPGGR